jgi:POT family proton-dependent oligopeptide transporter
MAGLQTDSAILAGLGEAQRDQASEDEKKVHHDEQDDKDVDDPVHRGLELPTEEERATLRRIADAIPWNAYRQFPDLFCDSASHFQ